MSTSTQRGTQRRQALLDAATDLFMEHGFEGTSLDMVIERAGGSRRSIYQYFDNKEGLFAATVEAMMERILTRLTLPDNRMDSPEETLTRLGSAFVTALIDARTVALFRMTIAEVDRFPDLGAELFARGPERAYELVATYLRELDARGTIVVTDPDTAARQLVEMVKGELQLRALLAPGALPGEATIAAQVRQAVETFLNGVRPRG